MKTPIWLALLTTVAALPAVAHAQVVIEGGVYVPPPPHVYVHQRVRWHHYRHLAPAPVVVAPAPPPVWIAPTPPSPAPPPVYMAPPPPPVVITPQQPMYVQPQPYYAPPPVYYTAPAPAPVAAAVVVEKPKPQFANRYGFGAVVEGMYSVGQLDGTNTQISNQGLGIMGQLRYRSSRHLGLELTGGYQQSSQDGFKRSDIPLTFGLQIPFLGPEYALTPYAVVAAGVNFADLKLIDAQSQQLDDQRTQFLAQAGGGLELRLGPRFAINGDIRAEARWNLNGPSEAVANTTSIDGKPVHPITDSVGVRAGIGASIFF